MRWKITENKRRIRWEITDAHRDDLEMAGRGASFIVTYGRGEDGAAILEYRPVFPTLRTRPNNTHASYQKVLTQADLQPVAVGGTALSTLTPVYAEIDGILTFGLAGAGVIVTHRLYPAAVKRAAIDLVSVTNTSDAPLTLTGDL